MKAPLIDDVPTFTAMLTIAVSCGVSGGWMLAATDEPAPVVARIVRPMPPPPMSSRELESLMIDDRAEDGGICI